LKGIKIKKALEEPVTLLFIKIKALEEPFTILFYKKIEALWKSLLLYLPNL